MFKRAVHWAVFFALIAQVVSCIVSGVSYMPPVPF
jgi:hypothetical protein